MSGLTFIKQPIAMAGIILLFAAGCTPDGSSSSGSGSSASSSSAQVSQALASPSGPGLFSSSNPGDDGPLLNSFANDDFVCGSLNGPQIDEPAVSVPEPATSLLFLCAAGGAALARWKTRKRA